VNECKPLDADEDDEGDQPASDEVNPGDEAALRVWRAECPELQALWDESQPVTAWQGVTFGEAGDADAGRVVSIRLGRKGLTGDVPAALGGLTALKRLGLSGNQLTTVPAELGGLTALERLNLHGNQLTSLPEAFGGLTGLSELYLSQNQLTGVPADLGRSVQVDPIKLTLKAPGTKRLKR